MTLWLIMVHHNSKFGNKTFGDSEDTMRHKQSLTFRAFTVTFTFNAATFFSLFHRTLRLIMPHHQTTFGCKRISSLKDRVETSLKVGY